MTTPWLSQRLKPLKLNSSTDVIFRAWRGFDWSLVTIFIGSISIESIAHWATSAPVNLTEHISTEVLYLILKAKNLRIKQIFLINAKKLNDLREHCLNLKTSGNGKNIYELYSTHGNFIAYLYIKVSNIQLSFWGITENQLNWLDSTGKLYYVVLVDTDSATVINSANVMFHSSSKPGIDQRSCVPKRMVKNWQTVRINSKT